MVKRILAVLLGLLMITNVQAKDNDHISQVIEELPTVTVYVDRSDTLKNPQAFLGNRQLRLTKKKRLSETASGTNYYVLCDNSLSVPNSYLTGMKKALLKLSGQLRKADTLQVYSFGSKLKKVTSSQDSKKRQQEKIRKMSASEHGTQLFKAVSKISDLASGDSHNQSHSVILLMSDGVDFTVGNTTKNEALTHLKQKNIPVYGIAFDETSKKAKDSFGAFVRESGGRFLIKTASNIPDGAVSLAKANNKQWVLTYDYGSNKITNKVEKLTIKSSDNRVTLSKDVLVVHYQPDHHAPRIKNISGQGKKLKIVFSELVENGDCADNYDVSISGSTLKVTKAVYQNRHDIVTLYFDHNLFNGTYTIRTQNIHDASMEKNALKKTYQKKLTNLKINRSSQLNVLELLPAAAIIAIIMFMLFKRKKKAEKNPEEEIVREPAIKQEQVTEAVIEEKKDPALSHHQIAVRNMGKTLQMDIVQAGIYLTSIDVTIDRSAIFGRASICDYCFDDPSLSRQHFALESKGNDLFVEDLESVNGTKLNGIIIKEKSMLKSGDVITAGNIDFRVRWE